MSVAFPCPQCQQSIAAEAPAGSAVSCPFCGRVVTVPASGGLPLLVQTVPFAVSTPDAPIGYATRSGEPPPRQGLAVAALVCGIAGVVTCFPLFGLAGVVLGIVALVRVNRDSRRHASKGLALGGLCTGIAGLVMLPVLIVILLPSLSRARELSKRTVCQANLRGLGQALYIYAQESNWFPEVGADWQARLLNDGNISPRMLICPGDFSGSACSYHYVPGYGPDSSPTQIILYEDPLNHNGEGGNVLRADGSVVFLNGPQFTAAIDSLTLPDGTPWRPHEMVDQRNASEPVPMPEDKGNENGG